ncbi:hypothetical protein [Flagellimonas sp.]|uniref:hypothetical protein n=1 Tax=Flagellimonas sp. TaxID=2058762 RepID=UPI003BAD669D
MNQILRLGVVAIFILVFFIGGALQFYVGISTTIYTIFIVSLIYLLVLLDVGVTQKISVNNVVLVSAFFFLIIIISGLFSATTANKVVLYSIFALIPMGVFLLIQIIRRRKIKLKKTLSSLAKVAVFVQLPIVLIQKYGYDYLINLNRSNQSIADYDFMFGTFFIRSDHALGFFLLIYLMLVLIEYNKGTKKLPWFTIFYVAATILIMESNLSKVFLIIVLSFYLFIWIFKKLKFTGVFVIAFMAVLIFNAALKVPVIKGHYENFQSNYSIQSSKVAFERTTAKRLQVIIVYATQMPLKIIGEGPYDYFNIFTGEFKKTQHYSQLIWSYNDLGIVGLLVAIALGWAISKTLGLQTRYRRLFFGLVLFYMLMTNVYSDIAICLSFMLLDEKID